MKFGPVPVADAVSAVLAHSVEAAERTYNMQMSYRIPKGTVLTADHIADLLEEGHVAVTVAQLEAGDVAEDAAAARLAAALVPDPEAAGLRLTVAKTGRVNIYADHAGVVAIDAAAINAINAVNPMLTVATLQPWQRVVERTMVATIKVIAYSVPEADLAQAAQLGAGALQVRGATYTSASLIETTTGKAPKGKGRAALEMRLQRLGMWLTDPQIVPHQVERLAEAMQQASGEVIFVLTGSATSDLHDTAPEALRAAGGTVEHFGMPVDPGNLLFLGRLGNKPVIGLPGCARSPALNGADWVLERVVCGVPVTAADIAGMGVGGLLKEIPTRPQPRQISSNVKD